MTNPQLRAARFANALASSVHDPNALRPERAELRAIAVMLDAAASILEALPAPVVDGVADATFIPDAAASALWTASEIAESLTNFPTAVLEYVTTPITGRMPKLQPLTPVSSALARQERDLHIRIATVRDHFGREDEAGLQFMTRSLLILHRDLDRLTQAVAVDNLRPCNRNAAG